MPIELIIIRIEGIEKDLQEISTLIENHDFQQFIKNYHLVTMAERWFERVVNRMIDINNFFIKADQGTPAKTYFESFIELSAIKIISKDLAENLAPAAGARNILIHEYEEINYEIFWQSLQNLVIYGKKYTSAIKKHL